MTAALQDVMWLSISEGRVLEAWVDERRSARRYGRRRAADAPVTTIKVHRKIWESALVSARGDAKRIRVHSATNVEVLLT